MFRLDGKVALVTGASRGLGWAMAQALARNGARVVLNARDAAAIQARVAEIEAAGGQAEAAVFDVTDTPACAAAVARTVERHGRLDILVANAGIQHRSPIADFPIEDFRRVIETNLVAVWALCKEAARVMQPAGRWGRPEEIGAAAAYLASDEAAFVNGHTLVVDGGFSASL
ncbi:MAG: SDR family oxidoreductase [Burkholderiales bacterium]|nr:SDR family oxidoreductase [Burkholderiales bacterium]